MVEGPLQRFLKERGEKPWSIADTTDRDVDRYEHRYVEVVRIGPETVDRAQTHGEKFNYKILGGNPMKGIAEWEVKVNKLKINDVACAFGESAEFAEHGVDIQVEVIGDLANIIVMGD